MSISNNENWHVDFNRSAMREIYPSRELNNNSTGNEYNNVNGKGAGGTAPWPGEYKDSLREVRNLGSIKEGFGFKFFSGATLTGGLAIAISMSAIMGQINKYKPKLNKEKVTISSIVKDGKNVNEINVLFDLTYNDKNKAILVVKGGNTVVCTKEYTLPPLDKGESHKTYTFKEKVVIDDLKYKDYKINFDCINSFGTFNVYSEFVKNPLFDENNNNNVQDDILDDLEEI